MELGAPRGSPGGLASLMLCAVLGCMEVSVPGTNGVTRLASPVCQPQEVIVCMQELELEVGFTSWRRAPPPWFSMHGSQFPPH